jgi:hypothetical protein
MPPASLKLPLLLPCHQVIVRHPWISQGMVVVGQWMKENLSNQYHSLYHNDSLNTIGTFHYLFGALLMYLHYIAVHCSIFSPIIFTLLQLFAHGCFIDAFMKQATRDDRRQGGDTTNNIDGSIIKCIINGMAT